jgi:DNA ligase-1
MKPMLATKALVRQLRYPLLASPKLDGIRCLIKDGKPVTRSLKPVPNKHVRNILSIDALHGLDGELIVGGETEAQAFNTTSSGVMSIGGMPDVKFWVFDFFDSDLGFERRLRKAEMVARQSDHVVIVRHTIISNWDALQAYEQDCVQLGFEGVMLRDPSGPYKHGRSTVKEGWLLKLKRFDDGEAKIVGVNPLMSNLNEQTINALGQKERSSKKSGMVQKELMGNIEVVDITTGTSFEIGTGFTQSQRVEFWERRESVVGKIVKYKSQKSGVKEKPRFPVFLGFRFAEDF